MTPDKVNNIALLSPNWISIVNLVKKKSISRIEPNNNVYDFDEGLQARVKDPLWLLGRQWQMSEFKACNGGNIVRVEVNYTSKPLNTIIHKNSHSQGHEDEILPFNQPLERIVEMEDENTNEAQDWDPTRLEYRFGIKNQDTKLNAHEYDGNQLDWFNFDLDNLGEIEQEEQNVSLKPSPVDFPGIPHARWWKFEDKNMDLSQISRPFLNYLQVMLLGFGLIYSNDWFILPIKQKIGHIRKLKKIKIIDSFGLVSEANPVIDSSKEKTKWEVFTLSRSEGKQSDGRIFYLPNCVYRGMESKPIEQVSFMRDEMANLAWAIEQKYQNQDKEIINRNDEPHQIYCQICRDQFSSERQLILHFEEKHPTYWDIQEEKIVEKIDVKGDGEPGKRFLGPLDLYQLMSFIPKHWIPFIPRSKNNNGEIMLRRGRTIVDLNGNTQYNGQILKESKHIYEEEIPRAGILVKRVIQLVRGTDGKIYIWKSRKKETDMRRKTSGLMFDRLLKK